tara:strand:- start:91 stop:474 length:384 start_codon:yes stop_codon:yes gene_type:complete
VSKKTIINTKLAPAAIGTYAQGIIFENLIFTSGQIPINPNTNEVVSDKFNLQVDQVLHNLNQVLKAAGSNKNNIIKLTVYLTDLSKFDLLNIAFKSFFVDSFPARSVVEVSALPKGVQVEIEAISTR